MNDKLQDIQLPALVLAEMYANHLVITEDLPVQRSETGAKGSKIVVSDNNFQAEEKPVELPKFWLGENLKNIVLIVNDNNNAFLDDSTLEFLGKILSACKLNLADTAIVNMAKNTVTLANIAAYLQPKYILLFDVSNQELQLPFALTGYKPQQQNGCTYLSAAALASMNNNTSEAKLEKTKFWNSLKQVFGL